jgi:hypothetical protein
MQTSATHQALLALRSEEKTVLLRLVEPPSPEQVQRFRECAGPGYWVDVLPPCVVREAWVSTLAGKATKHAEQWVWEDLLAAVDAKHPRRPDSFTLRDALIHPALHDLLWNGALRAQVYAEEAPEPLYNTDESSLRKAAQSLALPMMKASIWHEPSGAAAIAALREMKLPDAELLRIFAEASPMAALPPEELGWLLVSAGWVEKAAAKALQEIDSGEVTGSVAALREWDRVYHSTVLDRIRRSCGERSDELLSRMEVPEKDLDVPMWDVASSLGPLAGRSIPSNSEPFEVKIAPGLSLQGQDGRWRIPLPQEFAAQLHEDLAAPLVTLRLRSSSGEERSVPMILNLHYMRGGDAEQGKSAALVNRVDVPSRGNWTVTAVKLGPAKDIELSEG